MLTSGPPTPSERHTALFRALHEGERPKIWKMLNDMSSAEIADLLESLPPRERLVAWHLVNSENAGEVLLHVNDEVRAGLISVMQPQALVSAVESLDLDDQADILINLPQRVTREVLRSLDTQDRLRLEAALLYPEDSAGGLMNTDTVTVRATMTLDVVHRYLRLRGHLPDSTDALWVVNRSDQFLGALRINTLLTQDQTLTVSEVMDRDLQPLPANMPATQVAHLFAQRDFISAPVVDEHNNLIGRITIDDVVDVIREQADHALMRAAGLDENRDIFSPVFTNARRRALWLGLNLATLLLTTWVISMFEATLAKKVILAILMPISASMGGVMGNQTLTIVIRGMVLGQIQQSNAPVLIFKELAVGALNGLLWGTVVGALAMLWFNEPGLALFLGLALMLNLCCAACVGFFIPFVLKKISVDPAIAGTVILTTITDVVGYTVFLGSAALFLL